MMRATVRGFGFWAVLALAVTGCARSTAGTPAVQSAAGAGDGTMNSAANAPPAGGRGDATPRPSPRTPPLTEDACRACQGIWAVHGVASAESCNCRTTDGGTRCRDGGECQGMCIAAEDPEREVVEAGPPAQGYFVGRCSDLVTVYGCHRLIGRGTAAHGPSPLAEAPSSLCVD